MDKDKYGLTQQDKSILKVHDFLEAQKPNSCLSSGRVGYAYKLDSGLNTSQGVANFLKSQMDEIYKWNDKSWKDTVHKLLEKEQGGHNRGNGRSR